MDVYGKSVHPCQHTGATQMSLGTFLEWIHYHTHDSILIHGGELKMRIADMNPNVWWSMKEAMSNGCTWQDAVCITFLLRQSWSTGDEQWLMGNMNTARGRCWGQWLFVKLQMIMVVTRVYWNTCERTGYLRRELIFLQLYLKDLQINRSRSYFNIKLFPAGLNKCNHIPSSSRPVSAP